MFAEVTKRLKGKDVKKDTSRKSTEKSPRKDDDSQPILEMKSSSKSPPSSPKMGKTSPQSPPESPKSPPRSPPTSTKSPPRSPTRSPSRLPRLFRRSSKEKKSVEIPVEVTKTPSSPGRNIPNTDGDIDSPAPPSDDTSNISSAHQISARKSPSPSPVVPRSPPVESVKVHRKPSLQTQGSIKRVPQTPSSTKMVERKEVPIAIPKRDSNPPQSIPLNPAPPVVSKSDDSSVLFTTKTTYTEVQWRTRPPSHPNDK
jgi:hypothetical protein